MKKTILILSAIGIFFFAQGAQAQWEPAKRLTWNTGSSDFPSIAVDSTGYLHLVWRDETPGNFNVYYKKGNSGGSVWTANKRLTWAVGSFAEPVIAVDSTDKLHLLWTDNVKGNFEIHYRNSINGGDSWSTVRRVTWTPGASRYPVVAVDSLDRLHVAWQDDTPTPSFSEIYYKRSAAGGATWSTTKRLTWTAGDSQGAAVTVDGSDHVHVVWCDGTPGNYEIYYKRSIDGGTTWSQNRRLTWTPMASGSPDIQADASGHLHVAWEEDTSGGMEIYYRRSTDGGATWKPRQRLTWNTGHSGTPALYVESSGNIHLVWIDDTPGNIEVYYRMSSDKGVTWTTPKRLTWNEGNSFSPRLVVQWGYNYHLVWSDATPGNFEIYYRRQD
jgi:hypothetical protein